MKQISFVLAVCCLFFSGCVYGGTKDSDRIRATSIIGEDYLEIKVDVKNWSTGGNFCHFESEKNLADFKSVFDSADLEVGTLQTEIFGDRYLFVQKTNPDDKVYYYYLINKKENDGLFYYDFTTPFQDFALESLYVPLHLLANLSNESTRMETDTPYELTGSRDLFVEFYQNCFAYRVTEEESGIRVDVNADLLVHDWHTKKSFLITFEEKDGKTFVSYSFPESNQ